MKSTANSDVVTEDVGQGTDTIHTNLATYTLGPNVENLDFRPNFGEPAISHTGTGNALNNRIFGGASRDTYNGLDGHDTLLGSAGSDVLNGGVGDDTLNGDGSADGSDHPSGPSADVMRGGLDNDTYVVNVRTDLVIEQADQGIDEVEVRGLPDYTLGNHVEWLHFIGTGNFIGQGNALDNRIEGGASNDTLRGLGGVDVLLGGNGIDTFFGWRWQRRDGWTKPRRYRGSFRLPR